MSTELIKIDSTTTSSGAIIQQIGAIEIKMDGQYAYWRPTVSGTIDFIPFA